MTRARRRGALLVALALVLSGCGVPLDDRTHAIASDDVPFELLEATPTTTTSTTVVEGETTTTEATETIYLYFVRNNRVVAVRRDVPGMIGMKQRILLLAEPVEPEETGQALRSAVPPGSITDVGVKGGVATVDLTTRFSEVPTVEQQLAFAQIVYTLLQTPGVGQVAFTLAAAPIQAIDSQGVLLTRPATYEDYESLLAG